VEESILHLVSFSVNAYRGNSGVRQFSDRRFDESQ